MTYRTENSLSIPAQISPVNAPKLCSLMFCAPRRRFESRTAFDTDSSAVNGGQTTMSTSFTLARSIFKSLTKAKPSATVLFIFQLPATINFRFLFMRCFPRPSSGPGSRKNSFDYGDGDEDEEEIICHSAPPRPGATPLPETQGSLRRPCS